MNATQLRRLGFDEAADAAEAQQFEGERARVYVEHQRKSPLDAPLCVGVVDALEAEAVRRGTRWSTDEQRGEWKAEGEMEATRLADMKVKQYEQSLTPETRRLIEVSREAMKNQPPIEY